jgi:hypothetical protein
MKADWAVARPRDIRRGCIALLFCTSLVIAGCGGSGGADVAPDTGAAQPSAGATDNPDSSGNGTDNGAGENTDNPATPDTGNPDTDGAGETPVTPDENPGVTPEPAEPPTEPAEPTEPTEPTEPETGAGNETPEPESALALSGSVTSYPDDDSGIVASDGGLFLSDESESQSLSRNDMRPVQALVSLFLLADVDYQTPVATVKTDITGNYNVTAADVRDYLLQQALVTDVATEDEILSAFRALGRLQVRAVIVRERNGVRRAMAIQSIADPADVDDTGAPRPVAVDPIVHRVVKQIVDSIRESVASLESMGLSSTVVDQLIRTVVEEVVTQIDQVLEETANEVIEIPEGLTLDDVIETQEDELELAVEDEQLEQLAGVLDGSDVAPEDGALDELENVVAIADEVIDDEQSTLGSSLNSESQGLLSGFESVLNEQLNGSVETTINEAREAGTEEALAEVFGDRTDGVALEQALAAVEAEQDKQLRQSLRRFFLSLGLGVIIEENEAGDAGVVAMRLSLPYHLDADSLPGVAGLGEREIRLFKVGAGQLDADSEYTDDPLAQLGAVDENGLPRPPFKYVPALQDVGARLMQGLNASASDQSAQQAVNDAMDRIFSGVQDSADYTLLDRIEVLHELRERLHETTLVSANVIDTLVDNRDRQIPLKRIAATIAEEFEWVSEDIKLTPDGFAIHSDRRGPLTGGANTVDSSELVRALSFTLGDSPVATAQQLTEQDRFLAQFAPRAIESALQQYVFDTQTSLTDALLDIYPQDPSGYRDLVLGSATRPPEPDYTRARDRVARGLTAALPARLYGQTLTSDSEVNIRSALFFLDFALRGEYLIDQSRGFYTPFTITRDDGQAETRYVPDYGNVKSLEPIGEVSVAGMMSDLLNITEIDDGALFDAAVEALMTSLSDIPLIPEYQEHSVDEFIDELGPRSDLVDAACTVEMYDGSDPDADHQRLQLSVYGVDYVESTGERLKGERIDVGVSSELVDVDGAVRRTYYINGLPTRRDNDYGRDYVLRFEIDGYQNELPELHLYADGFVPEINLCDVYAPLYIGPDQAFVHIPGVGLVSDQSRPGFDVDANGNVIENTDDQFEWIDLSNFEVPGAPLYLTDDDEAEGLGNGDLRLMSDTDGYRLVGPENSGVGFARLHGSYTNGELELSLSQTDNQFPLYGLQAAVGANARALLESIAEGSVELDDSLLVYSGNSQLLDDETADGVSVDDDNQPAPESLYLFRDSEGRYWVLELRFVDVFTEADGLQRAFVDLGVASINSLGLIDVPNLAYDVALPVETDGNGTGVIEFHSLYYGDWLVLENPVDYFGANLLPPEVLSFAPTDDYEALRRAVNGVVIRYAGDHFDENVASIEDIESKFGAIPDFSAVPVRLDAGRDGITFVKLAFDKTEKRYVMDPLPQDAAPYVTQLSHNDLIAIFDDQSNSDGPVYLARVVRDFIADDPSANGQISLEVLRYDELIDDFDNYDEREVVCFTDDNGACPETYPALYSALDADNAIGIVYDNDADGLPFLFDPNDYDPNVPGFASYGDVDADYPGAHNSGDLIIESVAGVDDDGSVVRALIATTSNVYPGDIESITLQSALLGDAEQVVLTCEPPGLYEFGVAGGSNCHTHPIDTDVELEIYRQSEQGVSLLMLAAAETLEALGSYVDFNYRIDYRAPADADGQPLLCGDEFCPARAASNGVITVPLGRDIPVHGHVSVHADDEEPQDLRGLRELDVDREVKFTAAALPGAIEYELSLFCPSSHSVDETGAGEFYQPEEHLRFFAPAFDEEGRAVAPEFAVHVPWLAGRECQISLRSPVAGDAGDITGVSLYVQGGVKLNGASGPVYIDNETSAVEGDYVCIGADATLGTENCEADAALFEVQSLVARSQTDGIATLNLGADIISAHAEGENRELIKTRLAADAIVSFDGILDGVPASCAEVAMPGDIVNNCAEGAGDLSAAFTVSSDGTEMWSLLPDAIVEGPVNGQGNVSLEYPAYYTVVQLIEDVADDGTVSTSYEVLMTINIDVYDSPDGVREVYARFERISDNDFYQGDESDRQLRVSVPGYVRLSTSQGHEVDIHARALVDDELKMTFFVFQSQQLAGGHDLNGDGLIDIDAVFENGLWIFRFDPFVDDARDPSQPVGQSYPADAEGFRVATFSADQGGAEMIVRIAETEYLVWSQFSEDGNGSLEVIDQYSVDVASTEPLFNALDFEHFFPVDLAIASPFARDRVLADTADEYPGSEGGIDFIAPVTDSDGSVDGGFDFPTGVEDEFGGVVLVPGSEGDDGVVDSDAFDFDSEPVTDAFGETMFSDAPVAPYTSGFRADAERVAGILRGQFRTAQFFRADHLRGSSHNADCFGPQLYYQNHPDGADAEPAPDFITGATELYPSLPTGDLGIWTEYDALTGNACAAAQMDAQLDSARRRTFAGLVTMAGVVRRLSPEQQADVLAGATVSVADRMNALSLPNVWFDEANIGLDSESGEWSYKVVLHEAQFDADGTESALKTSMDMNFNPGSESDRWDYSGAIRFRVEDWFSGPQCSDGAVEHLSSVAFERVDQQQLNTEYRYGMFCGHGGSNGFDADNQVDPSYSAVDAVDGWANNFSVFVANVDVYSSAGTYAYTWQAGAHDSHSRVLNVGLNDHDVVDGEAWYGYGQSLLSGVDSAGEINGFICNWAGPGNSHALIEKAQRQWLEFDSVSNLFVVPAGGSNITYAPTNSCEYDSDTGGDFLYDRNLDGALADESSETVDVGETEVLPFDLAPPASSTYFGLDVEEVIALRGYTKPERPSAGR